MEFTQQDFENAYAIVKGKIMPTPIVRSDWLSREFNADVYLKLECLQPGRSFKIRGATVALFSADNMPKKVITASGGNHGLGVTIACVREDISCTVVLPQTTSSYRAELLRQLGAEVILHGDAFDDANEYALKLAENADTTYIHPFNDKGVMLGQGTVVMETLDQIGDFDLLLASVGGGGLLTGNSLALEKLRKLKTTEIISVETIGADCYAVSREKNKLTQLPAITSIANTLGAKKTTQFIFETLNRLVKEAWTVTDKGAVQSILDFLDKEKLLVEPATSCIISAMFNNREYLKAYEGKKIVLIICGSNVTVEEVEKWKEEFLS